jgi:hypothetical protein
MIRPYIPSHGGHGNRVDDARTISIDDKSALGDQRRAKSNGQNLRSSSVEVVPPDSPQISLRTLDSPPQTSDSGRNSVRISGSRGSARIKSAAVSESRLSTTDLLKANEVLRRENERLRLIILRANPDVVSATATTNSRAETESGEKPSSRGSIHTPALPSTRVVRFREGSPVSVQTKPGRPPPPPPPTPPSKPETPPVVAPGPSPFSGFFRHSGRPPRAGPPNLPDVRFREWVGNSDSLF